MFHLRQIKRECKAFINREEHVVHIDTFKELLGEHGLRVSMRKCYFLQPRVELLGLFIDNDVVHADVQRYERFAMHIYQVTKRSSGCSWDFHCIIGGWSKGSLKERALYPRIPPRKWRPSGKIIWAMLFWSGSYNLHFFPIPRLWEDIFRSNWCFESNSISTIISHLDKSGSDNSIPHASRGLSSQERNCFTYERE